MIARMETATGREQFALMDDIEDVLSVKRAGDVPAPGPASGVSASDVRVLSDGLYVRDGGMCFASVPRPLWSTLARPDRQNRVTNSLNMMGVKTGRGLLLVDAGMGHLDVEMCREIHRHTASKLARDLRRWGVAPRDVRVVILTHLHLPHAGGLFKWDRLGVVEPAFPRAEYFVQRDAWEDALENRPHVPGLFQFTQHLELIEGRVHMLDGPSEVRPGIWALPAPGHSPGHQIVTVEAGTRHAFLGDMAPTAEHLLYGITSAHDRSPALVLKERGQAIEWLMAGGWMAHFAHGRSLRSGYLEQRYGKLTITAAG